MLNTIPINSSLLYKAMEYWNFFVEDFDRDAINECLTLVMEDAQNGNSQAMRIAGEIYYGMEVDLVLNPDQYYYFASYTPENTWADWENAAFWFGEGSILENIESKFRYAQLLYYGHGCHQNYEAALQLFHQIEKSGIRAEQGCCSRRVDWYIQDLYLDCPGVARNEKKALNHIAQMLLNPDRCTMDSVASMYLGGQLEPHGGPIKNARKAISILEDAWDLYQQAYTAFHLGQIFAFGTDVPINTAKAKYWLKLASTHGCADAEELLESL